MNSGKTINPKWWNDKHASAWDRIKEALHRDWEQTKADFSSKGQDLDQGVGDGLRRGCRRRCHRRFRLQRHKAGFPIGGESGTGQKPRRESQQKSSAAIHDRGQAVPPFPAAGSSASKWREQSPIPKACGVRFLSARLAFSAAT